MVPNPHVRRAANGMSTLLAGATAMDDYLIRKAGRKTGLMRVGLS